MKELTTHYLSVDVIYIITVYSIVFFVLAGFVSFSIWAAHKKAEEEESKHYFIITHQKEINAVRPYLSRYYSKKQCEDFFYDTEKAFEKIRKAQKEYDD